ncbi:unnamed protein product [Aphis gossypii]|uniref:Uncharacterized protein n=1 Tax=Aphis gossypii TaxID=80765 RepID=A0A9P0IK65_APHGO|nr:unnamed protein product [Aphis gossypii]
MCVQSRARVCVSVCVECASSTLRARTARRRFACACVMRAAVCLPVVLATLHGPGWHKVVLPRARGHFSAQSFRLARCLHTPALRDAFSFFFPSLSFRRFPYYLLISPLSTRFSIGRHLAAFAGRSPRTLSTFRFHRRYEFEISAARNNRTRARDTQSARR